VLELPYWLEDVAVTVGQVATELDGDRTGSGVLWRATRTHFLLDVPGVARYLVTEGRHIRVQPAPRTALADVSRIARATPLSALLYQRGLLAFHAATAVRDGDAILLAGDSSSGKSTLLAKLLQRGWRMLGDDLAPVSLGERSNPIVMPTSAHLVLWPDSVKRLGWHALQDGGAGPGAGRIFELANWFGHEPTPVRSVWLLGAHNGEAVETDAITGVDAFATLASVTYNTRIARALLGSARFMNGAAALAGGSTLQEIRRPRGHWTVDSMADLVEAELALKA
jgi:hypothetical protein